MKAVLRETAHIFDGAKHGRGPKWAKCQAAQTTDLAHCCEVELGDWTVRQNLRRQS